MLCCFAVVVSWGMKGSDVFDVLPAATIPDSGENVLMISKTSKDIAGEEIEAVKKWTNEARDTMTQPQPPSG